MGEALGVGGYLTELRRTFIGRFKVGDAVTLERVVAEGVMGYLQGGGVSASGD